MSRNFVLNLLRQQASDTQLMIKGLKGPKGFWWNEAVPGAHKGEEAYRIYCHCRESLKKEKAYLKKLNLAIKTIKKGEPL